MARPEVFNISLARKCQLLFGLALLLIIAAALFVPGYYMETFVHELNSLRARELAMLAMARLDAGSPDWAWQQKLLDDWWEIHRLDLGLPPDRPVLILLQQPEGPSSPLALLAWMRSLSPRVGPAAAELADWLGHTHRGRLLLGAVRAVGRVLPEPDDVLPDAMAAVRQDPFLVKSVQALSADDSLMIQRQIIRRFGQPSTYRVVLAVREVKASAQRRPLIGLIDVKLAAPQTDQMLLWTRLILVLAGMLAGFMGILVFYLVTQKLILAPVRELKSLVEQVAGGDLAARSTIATGDEFQELSDAFNLMLARLEKARTELETINRSLDARLGELAETNVALFESNKVKSEFLASVTHELRTPLTSIIGFADLLRDALIAPETPDRSRLARFADIIVSSGRDLLNLINDLLDLARLEAGRVEIHRTSFPLAELCEALHDFLRPLIDKKLLSMELRLAEDLPPMDSDAGKIRQILYNLLSNAIKYTPEGGRIGMEVDLAGDGRQVRLTVWDTGPGIAPEHQARLFEKFYQLDSSVTREHGGTGLGLAITKELVLLLGGQIRLESEPGRGSRFTVELPVRCPDTVRRSLPSLV